jgi:hypothetical protein
VSELALQDPKPDAFVVTLVENEPPEITIADVVYGSFGIVGVLVLSAIVLGAVLSMLFVLWNRRHPPEDDHMPPVSPLIPAPGDPPSFRAR